jgi:hypothetical protein
MLSSPEGNWATLRQSFEPKKVRVHAHLHPTHPLHTESRPVHTLSRMTFAEAHAHSGRVLNISCTPLRTRGRHAPPLMLNHELTPDVDIASARIPVSPRAKLSEVGTPQPREETHQ